MTNKFLPMAKKPDSLLYLRPDIHGWERFGENHTSDIKPFIEGAWMTKHNGKYYLQYAAPGTQFNVYGDGVYVGKSPLGPFQYALIIRSATSREDLLPVPGMEVRFVVREEYTGISVSIHLSINYKFERRLCYVSYIF